MQKTFTTKKIKPRKDASTKQRLIKHAYEQRSSKFFASRKATLSPRDFTSQKSRGIANKPQSNKLQEYKSTKKFKSKEPVHRSVKGSLGSVGGQKLRIIPLGGCEEVGRNMTVFEYDNDIVIIDMGIQFPEEDHPGIDFIIPNTEYLKGKEKNIRGVIFTHGHLDHIGAAPILLEKLGNPLIIGGKLTLQLIKARQEDYKPGTSKNLKTRLVESYNYTLKLGKFKIKFFPVSHSVMDSMGVIIEIPKGIGTVIHPGDWKIESDPQGKKITYKHLSKLSKPTILMLESLGVTYTKPPVSEKEMYKNIEKVIKDAPGRIIIGTFASNMERIKIVLEIAEKYKRKVAVDGFSMRVNMEIAKKLGYIKFNLNNLIDISNIINLPDNKIVVIATGAQGEDRAVLNRIVNGTHRFIKFKKQDTVIFSSSVIPGNERTVQKLKDAIYRQCDNVIHSEIMDVHSGGHATASGIKEIIKQIRPTYFIPVYANHYMLKEAAKLVKIELNYNDKNIFVPDNGSVIEFTKQTAKILPKKVNSGPVMVDGLGISDLQNVVLRDRQILAEQGMVVIITTIKLKQSKLAQNPDIISRGFVYLKENKELLDGIRKKVRKIIEQRNVKTPPTQEFIKTKIRNDIGQFLFSKTGKRPMVLPVVIEV